MRTKRLGITLFSIGLASSAAAGTLFHHTGYAPGDEFGFSVAGAFDVNADGMPDAVIGAWLDGTADIDGDGFADILVGAPSLFSNTNGVRVELP